jgi:hypothetical protein
MKTVKEATDNLLKNGKITQEEYDCLEKIGATSVMSMLKGLQSGMSNFIGWKPLEGYLAANPSIMGMAEQGGG